MEDERKARKKKKRRENEKTRKRERGVERESEREPTHRRRPTSFVAFISSPVIDLVHTSSFPSPSPSTGANTPASQLRPTSANEGGQQGEKMRASRTNGKKTAFAPLVIKPRDMMGENDANHAVMSPVKRASIRAKPRSTSHRANSLGQKERGGQLARKAP